MTELVTTPQFGATALGLPESLTFSEWEAIGHQLHDIEQARQWWIGDWINYGERRYGEHYAQALDATGLDYKTLANYAWVAKAIPEVLRKENLSWTHHREVAALEAPEREAMLDRVAQEGLSVAATRLALKEGEPTKDEPRYEFVTTLRILHSATDSAHAQAWAEKLVGAITSRGGCVTKHITKAT